jgi:hypothetical protein
LRDESPGNRASKGTAVHISPAWNVLEKDLELAGRLFAAEAAGGRTARTPETQSRLGCFLDKGWINDLSAWPPGDIFDVTGGLAQQVIEEIPERV